MAAPSALFPQHERVYKHLLRVWLNILAQCFPPLCTRQWRGERGNCTYHSGFHFKEIDQNIKMGRILPLALISLVFLTSTHSMIMRNNALMSKMVSQFQDKDKEPRDHREHEEIRRHQDEIIRPQEENRRYQEDNRRYQENQIQDENHGNVLSLMQNVLCKNFPSIPCELITKDDTLKQLIEKSIQQLKYKKMTLERSTPAPNFPLTLFPVINSEDLSNFLQVSNTGFFKQKKTRKKQKKSIQEKNIWSHEKKTKSKTAVINGRKKIRKFYPHKIKYKDKNEKSHFTDYSDEKLSMSVETPREHNPNIKRKHFSYRGDPVDPPVWRIDYMKHGEPSLNMFGYESDSLKGKIIKTGPNVIVDENVLEQAARRDVLRPDVYIKKSYPRKNTRDNSEAMD